jgi:hypothetical protein
MGAWVLVTDRGEQLQLVGPVPPELRGRAVVVEGATADALGAAMVGPIIQVKRVRPA